MVDKPRIDLEYGPCVGKTLLIYSNEDGEGGGFDVFSGDKEKVENIALALREYNIQERENRVEFWKRMGWKGGWYSKIHETTILVIYPGNEMANFSIPEEETGIS